jgi:hypothetical protein
MESLSKFLDLAAKYAWAVLIVTAFVIFIPEDVGKKMGLESIKIDYKGYLWLVLVFSSVLVTQSLLHNLRQPIWRFIICPVLKLIFPVKDLRTGIKQSRMRYYLLQFTYRNNEKHDVFQEADSNGNVIGYFDSIGNRFLPKEQHEASHLDCGKFQFPKWGRIDWCDIFNGNKDSGCWGISER